MNKYQKTLQQYWGYDSFRPLQEDIIRSVDEHKKDTLGLLPTGGGKSIIFQVPALASPGICLVVTPLIALMKDQVENLKTRGIKAAAIYSGMSRREIETVYDNCAFGDYKFLYISPERLATDMFRAKVQAFNVNLIAIDEAHCISQWGYDFRPSYLNISSIRELVPNAPFLALTATATPEVVVDIQEKLNFKTQNLFQKSFARENLTYIVREIEDKNNYLLRIVTKTSGSGVVYVRNRKRTKEIAEFLLQNGISADYYHAGIEPKQKDQKQDHWKQDKTRIIVSTNAFGMGIDKPDVRFVVHMDLPDSLEAYFQEAGRGGRDGKRAYAVLLYNNNDVKNLKTRISTEFPEREIIKRVYNALCNYYQIPIGGGKGQTHVFKLRDFIARFKFSVLQAYNSVKFLQQEGYLELTEDAFIHSRVQFTVSRDDLYKFQVANAKFDAFIKLLLRSYAGLFSQYTKIDEDFLAAKGNTTRDIVYKYLVTLAKSKVIDYIPQKKDPFIYFTEERLDDKNLRISKENYEKRKERFQKKIEAVIGYVTQENKCRSRFLLEYFGEKNTNPCQQCDVCRAINEKTNTLSQEKTIERQLLAQLEKQPEMELKQLVDSISEHHEKVILVIQAMLDANILQYTNSMRIKKTAQ